MLYIGVDIGGTFTDLVVMDESGAVVSDKAPTTPGQLEQGVFDALTVIAGDRRRDARGAARAGRRASVMARPRRRTP